MMFKMAAGQVAAATLVLLASLVALPATDAARSAASTVPTGGGSRRRAGGEAKPARPAKAGMLIVGLGGNNGATLAACVQANRRSLSWETPQGRMDAAEVGKLGCISQLENGPLGEHLGPLNVAQLDRIAIGGECGRWHSCSAGAAGLAPLAPLAPLSLLLLPPPLDATVRQATARSRCYHLTAATPTKPRRGFAQGGTFGRPR